MQFDLARSAVLAEDGVELSTMMRTPCLRYRGEFLAMLFEREDALIIKVPPERVAELIASGKGKAFEFTKKRFTTWVLIPSRYAAEYETFIHEALGYAREAS